MSAPASPTRTARSLQQMDLLEALARREAGQGLAIAYADTDYRERLTTAIKALAARGEAFCSDDIRLTADDPPCHPNLIGAVVQGAMKRGIIRQVSTTRSHRVVGHGNKVGVYIGAEFSWP